MKILLVEDDEATASILASALTNDRHTINIATDGQMGLMLAETYSYDLILLDVLIPKLDGITICRTLRSEGMQMPILLLTAKDSQTDKILGLDAGADDYVVKPFDLEELKARIRALLRRGSTPLAAVLQWENLCLDPNASEVTYNGNPVPLTPKEYSILELFLRSPQRVFSRSAIIDRLWAIDDSPGESAVTTHIKDLRQKLKASGMTADLIETVYGLGYRLKSPPPATPAAPEPRAAKGMESLNRVIEKFRNSFIDQVGVLQQLDGALQAGTLTAESHKRAQQESHKLAGSLGIFGYPEGSKLARQAELLLADGFPLEQMAAKKFSQLVWALQQELVKPPLPMPLPGMSSGDLDSSPPMPPSSNDPLPFSVDLNGSRLSVAPRILIIDDDVTLTEQLQVEASAQGMRVESAVDPAVARQSIAQSLPDLVLLDLTFSNSSEDGLSLLAELTQQHPNLPVLVFTGRDSLDDRVQVSRLGGKAFLHKPIPVDRLLQAITQALPQSQSFEAKILVVDDDIATLTMIRHLLQPWGLQVTTLNDPQQFWEALITIKPNLVVVDLEMPTFSGIDLCQVVRHDPQWGDLPLLVVTAHTDAKSIQQVFAAGADDFIAKPVVGPELVTRILSRIERVRSRQTSSVLSKS